MEKAGPVYWVQDSMGVSSCHINDGSLSLKDALIGTLVHRADGWHAILKDGTDLTPKGLETHTRAAMCLEKHYRGETVEKPVVSNEPRIELAGKAPYYNKPRNAQNDKYPWGICNYCSSPLAKDGFCTKRGCEYSFGIK
jgi:hypothetical protein